ncbi:MAG: hypothetical protein F6K35_37220 [Okeania sp. SIO2H7]|nr:hypothetical protein [Okeania sp. SIO2H7]
MATVKTAISLQESLFEQAEALAAEMNVSRSRLIAIALEEFIRRHHNRQLLEKINAAYAEIPPSAEEPNPADGTTQNPKNIVEGEW